MLDLKKDPNRKTPEMVTVQVRSLVTGRVLGEKCISDKASSLARDTTARSILKDIDNWDERDVYITVMDSNNDLLNKFEL